jgi:hypothetical protein
MDIIKKQNLLLIEQKIKISDDLKSQNERHIEALNKVNKILSEIKCQSKINSYADVAKSEGFLHLKTNQRHIVIVRPEDNKTSKQTEDMVKKHVKPNDLKIGIKSIRYISRGGLSIECRDEKECQLLSEEIGKQTLRLKATKPEKKRPTIVLKNVSPDIHQTDLFENILEKNYEIKDYFENQNKDINEELKIKFKFRKSNSNSKDMYCLEVSPELRKLMLRIGRIFIGWETCKIEDSLPIIRCFKCHGFGHKSMECQTAVEKCGHCGGDHQSKDCSTER